MLLLINAADLPMGTNYFLHSPPCLHCGHEPEPLHIGKSSGGWCFALHIHPEQGLHDWQDIWARISAVEELGGFIEDECGRTVESGLFFAIVWDNSRKEPHSLDWLRANHALPGPYGLARRAIDGDHVVGHGDGPFDYCIGEFS
jgi:hypothetical protein